MQYAQQKHGTVNNKVTKKVLILKLQKALLNGNNYITTTFMKN